MEISLDLRNYKDNAKQFKRKACRAIIKIADDYLFVSSKYGDYKFPGGGIEDKESNIEALVREVKEETGYNVKKDSISFLGKVIEKRKGIEDNILVMESFYYICEVEQIRDLQNLDPYEKDYDYKVVWQTLEFAIEANNKCQNLDKCPWVTRELKVMKYILNKKKY